MAMNEYRRSARWRAKSLYRYIASLCDVLHTKVFSPVPTFPSSRETEGSHAKTHHLCNSCRTDEFVWSDILARRYEHRCCRRSTDTRVRRLFKPIPADPEA